MLSRMRTWSGLALFDRNGISEFKRDSNFGCTKGNSTILVLAMALKTKVHRRLPTYDFRMRAMNGECAIGSSCYKLYGIALIESAN